MSNDGVVLDTLRFEGDEVFLKRFHAERTFEALQIKNPSVKESDILAVYNQIEKKTSAQVQANQIVRLFFYPENPLDPLIEIVEKTSFPSRSKLQILSVALKTAGRGPQNYKWKNRTFWTDVLKQKNNEADDLILLNENGHVTETSRCNLFFYDRNLKVVWTPTLDSGCINGVYRRYVMSSQEINLPQIGLIPVVEKDLLRADLKDLFIYTANSIRGVVPAEIY